MFDNLGSVVLTILASIGGLAGLLVVMTLLEPSRMSARAQRVRSDAARRRG